MNNSSGAKLNPHVHWSRMTGKYSSQRLKWNKTFSQSYSKIRAGMVKNPCLTCLLLSNSFICGISRLITFDGAQKWLFVTRCEVARHTFVKTRVNQKCYLFGTSDIYLKSKWTKCASETLLPAVKQWSWWWCTGCVTLCGIRAWSWTQKRKEGFFQFSNCCTFCSRSKL